METVDILGHDSCKLSLSFKLRQFEMSGIGLSVKAQHFCSVKAVEFISLALEERVTENGLWGIIPLL